MKKTLKIYGTDYKETYENVFQDYTFELKDGIIEVSFMSGPCAGCTAGMFKNWTLLKIEED